MWRLVSNKPRTREQRRILHLEIAIELIAVVLTIFIGWPIIDRRPPWVRLYGEIAPTPAGGEFSVTWHTTPLREACPGQLQIEVQSGRVIWPVLRRQVSDALKLGQTTYTTPPWPLALTVPPGEAVYRVTSFWYCNWFQEMFNVPVIQVGPDIEFEVLPAVLPPTTAGPRGTQGTPGAQGPAGPQGPQGERGENR
jgi:hypothetical protein